MYFDEKGALQVYMKNAAELRSADAMKAARSQVTSAIASVLGAEFLTQNAAAKGRAQEPNIIKGDYDVVELAKWKKSFSPALDGQEIVFVDLDERRNRVTIGVVGDPSRQRFEALAKSLGVPFEALIIEETQPIRFHASLRDKSRPVPGGVQIEIDTGVFAFKICTLGFNVVRNGRDGFVTNSHCTKNRGVSNDDDFHQPNDPLFSGNKIGDEDSDPPYFTGGVCPSGRKCRFSDSAYADYRIDRGRFEIARTTNNVGSLTINGFPSVFRIMSETPDSVVGHEAQQGRPHDGLGLRRRARDLHRRQCRGHRRQALVPEPRRAGERDEQADGQWRQRLARLLHPADRQPGEPARHSVGRTRRRQLLRLQPDEHDRAGARPAHHLHGAAASAAPAASADAAGAVLAGMQRRARRLSRRWRPGVAMHPRLAALPGAVPGAVARGSGRRLALGGTAQAGSASKFPRLGV